MRTVIESLTWFAIHGKALLPAKGHTKHIVNVDSGDEDDGNEGDAISRSPPTLPSRTTQSRPSGKRRNEDADLGDIPEPRSKRSSRR